MVEEGALRPSRNPVTRGWDATTAHRACRDGREVGSQPRCGGLDRLDQRCASPSVPSEGFETVAAQPPQPPVWASPVVEEGALRPSRNPVTRGWDATTAHRACRDGREVGSQPRCGGLDRLDQRCASPSVPSEGFETVAAQPPQPPVWASPVVEEGALRPSRNPVTRGWDATTAHRACRDGREVGSQPRCGGLDRLDQRCASPSVPSEGFETVAAQPPQPPVWASPVVEEGALRPSRNPVTRGWDGTTAHRACRDGREVGSQPRCGGLDRLDQRCASPSAASEGFETVAAQPPQPPVWASPVVEEGALRPSRNPVT